MWKIIAKYRKIIHFFDTTYYYISYIYRVINKEKQNENNNRFKNLEKQRR